MKQLFYNYTLWEDYQNGMYNEDKDGRNERIIIAKLILTNLELLETLMRKVITQWKYATKQNLTNPQINYQAFLGQCACCIYCGVHEDETRAAWRELTEQERYAANNIADKIYLEWKNSMGGNVKNET